ncbi:hypothetical protein GCM10010309_45600 [Streptomyces violaceochromogenes]|nr:hypothetical protein GCM10010309_45600 [Streptomyces violaceochromogenes]
MPVSTSTVRGSRAPDQAPGRAHRPGPDHPGPYPYPDQKPYPTNFHTLHITRSLLMATPATTPGTTGTETTGAASAAIAASAGAEAIRTWLTERVAYFLDVRPQDIAADDLLVEIGLDSVYALTLCGDVEDEFGILVEATLAWDHPTIDALTAHIHSELAAR